MKEWIFLLCVCAVTAYLVVTALEDFKTCEVTRWKHLLGGIPAILMFFVNLSQYSWEQNAMILAFSMLYVIMGFVGVYGFADGLVLAVLTLFFGSVGGVTGSGAVLLIGIIASFSFLFNQIVKNIINKRKIFQNMTGPFIPHILMGYGSVCVVVLICLFKG